MAGSDPSGAFDPDEFTQNIRAAMLLGLPNDPAKRPIFLFVRERTYDKDDKAGQPFDWTATPVTDSDTLPGEPRQVLCGDGAGQALCTWEAAGGRGGTQSNETPFGDFDDERLVFTFLDDDFALVAGFDRLLLNDATYRYQFETPAVGLYEVTVHQVVVQAIDEA